MKPQIVHNENNIAATAIYESPTIKTYSSSELLDMIGPVLAGCTSNCPDDDNIMGVGYYASEDEVV